MPIISLFVSAIEVLWKMAVESLFLLFYIWRPASYADYFSLARLRAVGFELSYVTELVVWDLVLSALADRSWAISADFLYRSWMSFFCSISSLAFSVYNASLRSISWSSKLVRYYLDFRSSIWLLSILGCERGYDIIRMGQARLWWAEHYF